MYDLNNGMFYGTVFTCLLIKILEPGYAPRTVFVLFIGNIRAILRKTNKISDKVSYISWWINATLLVGI